MAKQKNSWKPGAALFVKYAEMNTTEDSYEEGEIGRDQFIWSEGVTGPYRNYAEIVDHFASVISAPEEKAAWIVYDEEMDAGRVEAQWIVNADNATADRHELEMWKQGKTRLWSARLNVWVIAVTIEGPPSSESIVKASGFGFEF